MDMSRRMLWIIGKMFTYLIGPTSKPALETGQTVSQILFHMSAKLSFGSMTS